MQELIMKKTVTFQLRYGYLPELNYADVQDFPTLAEAKAEGEWLKKNERKELYYKIFKITTEEVK